MIYLEESMNSLKKRLRFYKKANIEFKDKPYQYFQRLHDTGRVYRVKAGFKK